MIGVLVCINVMLVAALLLALLEQRKAFVRGYELGERVGRKSGWADGWAEAQWANSLAEKADDEEAQEDRESQPECWQ